MALVAAVAEPLTAGQWSPDPLPRFTRRSTLPCAGVGAANTGVALPPLNAMLASLNAVLQGARPESGAMAIVERASVVQLSSLFTTKAVPFQYSSCIGMASDSRSEPSAAKWRRRPTRNRVGSPIWALSVDEITPAS